MARRARIIATLGPGTFADTSIERLVSLGIDAARINLSFGTPSQHKEAIAAVRRAAQKARRDVAIVVDLPGPKLRLGPIAGDRIGLVSGANVRLCARSEHGDRAEVSIEVGRRFFHDGLMAGDQVLLGDGVVELMITRVGDLEANAEVVHGGDITSFASVHLHGMALKGGPVWDEDKRHFAFAVDEGVDYIALTYVQNANDLLGVKEHLERLGRPISLITKIERSEAFARLDGILGRSDAVMIRRSDLGVDIELSRVPIVQKEIVRMANNRGVPVIVATQMLGSMVKNPRPTRAEASDVYNAIADGADGVMLSAETAVGAHPFAAVEMMDRIIVEAEREHHDRSRTHELISYPTPFPDATARASVRAAQEAEACVIACFTESGRTAMLVAKYRPNVPIIAFSQVEAVGRRLALVWGVKSDRLEPIMDAEEMVRRVDHQLVKTGVGKPKDRVVIVFGAPVGEMGHTNSIRLHVLASQKRP